MVEKICSHCGTPVLVELQYCPGCLRAVSQQNQDEPVAVMTVAPDAQGTRIERIQAKWDDFATWLTPGANPPPSEKDDPQFAYKMPSAFATMSMTAAYTRVVCPNCLRVQRAAADLPPSAMLTCDVCLHQFPGSFAAEFRKGADLECFQCGVTTFCVNGSNITHCPNCKVTVKKARDPEKAKIFAVLAFVGFAIFLGFSHAVATHTVPQFLLWFTVASVFTFVGFLTMVALGF